MIVPMKIGGRNRRKSATGRLKGFSDLVAGAGRTAAAPGRHRAARPFLNKRNLFIAVLAAVTIFAVFGDRGLIDVYWLKNERDGIREFNAGIEKENLELEKKITLLKTDRKYIEHIAKAELGMIGRNEIVYKIEAGKKPE